MKKSLKKNKKPTKKYKKTFKKNKKKKNKNSKKKQNGGASFLRNILGISNKNKQDSDLYNYNESNSIIINRVKYLQDNNKDIYTATKIKQESQKDSFGIEENPTIEFNPYLGSRISEMKNNHNSTSKNCDNPLKNPQFCREAIKSVEDNDNKIISKRYQINNKINIYLEKWESHLLGITTYLKEITNNIEKIKNNNIESNKIIEKLLNITKFRRENGIIEANLLNEINNINNPDQLNLNDDILDKYVKKIIDLSNNDFDSEKMPISLKQINNISLKITQKNNENETSNKKDNQELLEKVEKKNIDNQSSFIDKQENQRLPISSEPLPSPSLEKNNTDIAIQEKISESPQNKPLNLITKETTSILQTPESSNPMQKTENYNLQIESSADNAVEKNKSDHQSN